ncbi:MAG: hypothetical protein U9N73_10120 [Candidatus Auribacterota bacterium]|nr:hypothetical protein [Candidatus Auribacterota bacterium]
MKRIIITLLLSTSIIMLPLFMGGCSSPRDRIDSMALVSDWPSGQSWRVAVLDFNTPPAEDKIEKGITLTPIDNVGEKMPDAVAGLLDEEPGYLVEDRDLMLKTLRDRSLPTSGIPPADQLAEIGKVLEVDGLVLGRCEGWHWGNRYEWGERSKASLWLIMAESGRTAWKMEGEGSLIGSDKSIVTMLSQDMVKKLMAGSGKAPPPPELSPWPSSFPEERKSIPVMPVSLAQISPPPEKQPTDIGIPSLPDEFSSIDAIKQTFADPKIKGRGDPASTHLNQYGYDIFVIWVNPFSGRKATDSFAYIYNSQTEKWNILDRSNQEGEESLRNVYIDPGTSRLIYMGENGNIIREIPLGERK